MKKEISMPSVIRVVKKEKNIRNLKFDIHKLQNERDTYKNQRDALLMMFKNLYDDFKKSGIVQNEPNKFFISKLISINNVYHELQKNPMMKF